jgi:hypothetical protein
MSASRWNAPAGCIIARRFLHGTYVLYSGIAHRLDCQRLARVPLAKVRTARLDALARKARLCPLCIAPARRDPARVEVPRHDGQRTDDDQSRRTP